MSMLLAALLFVSGLTVALDGHSEPQASPDRGVSAEGDRLYRMARTELAKRLGIEERKVKKLSVEPRIWPDASLGCPKPDTMYAQVETPGVPQRSQARGAV